MALDDLLQWLKSRNITFDSDLVEIRSDTALYSGDAWGVFARAAIQEGAVLATIPKKAVLSVRNSQLAALLEEHRISGGLGLVVAVMHEIATGDSSFWCSSAAIIASMLLSLVPRATRQRCLLLVAKPKSIERVGADCPTYILNQRL